ncbi:hypothetical protein [Marimonas arenosa]|uniref:Transmembrane protein n=1 Tax=Marimonas arenosa TaxID=1795305 RepID=A0AAE3WCJ9_9RHOB|nr:hypothetical protein [Marimonas arenosa]MDQ2090222.1 hypothetical protein [Marimonas arenosa]
MSEDTQYSKDDSKRAFQQGMLMALAIAFAPLAILFVGMLISGKQPGEYDTGLRYGLIVLWLVYVFTADRIAGLKLWLRIPVLRMVNTGEVITVIAFSALLATMRLDPAMARTVLMAEWIKGFGLMLSILGGLYLLYKATSRSRRIARARRETRIAPSKRIARGAGIGRMFKRLVPGHD